MSQTRAAIVGTGAFPLILRLFLETFKMWQDEVDVLYVAVDHYSEPSTRGYIQNLVKQFPKAKLLENCNGWPNSYKDAYLQSKEDNFLFLHDDTFIYKKGVVDKYFKIAEDGQVAVPLHGIYEPKGLVDEALKKLHPEWPDNAPFSFLLYFLFISRANLEKTNIDFNGIGWEKGQDIPLLGIKDAPCVIGGDTGWIIGLELLEKEIPFHPIFRSETANLAFESEDIIPLLIRQMSNTEGIFKEGWVHLQNTGNTIPLWFGIDLDSRRWHKNLEEPRLAWMYEMIRTESFDEIPEFKKKAEDILNGVVVRCGGDLERIKTLANIFHVLLYN